MKNLHKFTPQFSDEDKLCILAWYKNGQFYYSGDNEKIIWRSLPNYRTWVKQGKYYGREVSEFSYDMVIIE